MPSDPVTARHPVTPFCNRPAGTSRTLTLRSTTRPVGRRARSSPLPRRTSRSSPAFATSASASSPTSPPSPGARSRRRSSRSRSPSSRRGPPTRRRSSPSHPPTTARPPRRTLPPPPPSRTTRRPRRARARRRRNRQLRSRPREARPAVQGVVVVVVNVLSDAGRGTCAPLCGCSVGVANALGACLTLPPLAGLRYALVHSEWMWTHITIWGACMQEQ
jgi:hypothetical protein